MSVDQNCSLRQIHTLISKIKWISPMTLRKALLIVCCLFLLVILWVVSERFSGASTSVIASQQDEIAISDHRPDAFVLFTMPKTGTHLMRPLLEFFTGKDSVSYWSKEIDLPKDYLYNKEATDQLISISTNVQAYWLQQPVDTNSFMKVLDRLDANNDFLVTHAPYSKQMEELLKERNAITFFLIRDPRDWIVSVIKHPPISGVDIFGGPIGDRHFLSLNNDQKIRYILEGTPVYYSILETYHRFLGWKNSPVCCALRFEALLGPRGGSYSVSEQIAELRKIADALYIDVDDDILLEAFDESFGVGKVFSKAKTGSWKEYFNAENKELFKQRLGTLLIELGYEKDNNW